MNLFEANDEVYALETALSAAQGTVRLQLTVALAWHWRQRHSTEAMVLIGRARVQLAAQQIGASTSRALRLRLALTACEANALLGEIDAAERQLIEIRSFLLNPTATHDADSSDAWLAEAAIAKARGQRARELDAHSRCIVAAESSRDAGRVAVAHAWAAYEHSFEFSDAGNAVPGALLIDVGQNCAIAVAAFSEASQALLLSRRAPARAAEGFLRAAGRAHTVGLLRHEIICALNAGTALQGLGKFQEAADCFERAVHLALESGWPTIYGASQSQLGMFLKEMGFLDEAHTALTNAVAAFHGSADSINKANALSALSQVLLAMGFGVASVEPSTEAVRMYRAAVSTDNLALALIYHARSLSAAGRPWPALAALDEAVMLIERFRMAALMPGVNEALFEIHRAHRLPAPEGMLAPTAAIHYAEATLTSGFALDDWKPPVSIYVFLSEAWTSAGDIARALDYARKAIDIQTRELAQKFDGPLALFRLRRNEIARAAAERRDAAKAPKASSEQTARSLTRKEREILRLLARNYSNKEIAIAIDVSAETVKWHLKHIFEKLGVSSRKLAVNRARALDVLKETL
jgi:DNA-binding CsgD family transcriptional regulator